MASDPDYGRPFRLLITGSRNWSDQATLEDALQAVCQDKNLPQDAVLVSGACPTGADAMAELYWASTGRPVERHPADWRTGRAAGPRRNQHMVDQGADLCLAFPLGESRGTWDCVRRAKAAGIPVTVISPPPR